MGRTVKSFKFKNLSPNEAKRFLIRHDFELVVVEGSHFHFFKEIQGKVYTPWVIDNNKQIYWQNVEIMINKSGIPKEEWIKELCLKDYRSLKK